MSRLIGISCLEGLLPETRNTPIGLLLEYHNLGRPEEEYTTAQLIDFALSETKRLRQRYSGVQVAPLLYRVEDHLLYWIRED